MRRPERPSETPDPSQALRTDRSRERERMLRSTRLEVSTFKQFDSAELASAVLYRAQPEARYGFEFCEHLVERRAALLSLVDIDRVLTNALLPVSRPEEVLIIRLRRCAIIHQRYVSDRGLGFRYVERHLASDSIVRADNKYFLAFGHQFFARVVHFVGHGRPCPDAAQRIDLSRQIVASELPRQVRIVQDDDHWNSYCQRGCEPRYPSAAFPIQRHQAEERDNGGRDPIWQHARMQGVKPIAEKQRRAHAEEEKKQWL